jgi:hypothetical protein
MTDALRPRETIVLRPDAPDEALRPTVGTDWLVPDQALLPAQPPVSRHIQHLVTIHEDYALGPDGRLHPILPPAAERIGAPFRAGALLAELGLQRGEIRSPALDVRGGIPWVGLLGLSLGLALLAYLLWPAPYTPSPAAQHVATAPATQIAPLGELVSPPSIAAQQIDDVLASYGSPATGQGQAFYDLGVEYGIDPAYALAFFIHESSAGTNPAWAGLKGDGTTTHNIGNIICAGYVRCHGRFRDYASWEEGIRDWYRLIRDEYIEGRGLRTVGAVLPIYAPSADNNNPAGYAAAVEQLVSEWRAQSRAAQQGATADAPTAAVPAAPAHTAGARAGPLARLWAALWPPGADTATAITGENRMIRVAATVAQEGARARVRGFIENVSGETITITHAELVITDGRGRPYGLADGRATLAPGGRVPLDIWVPVGAEEALTLAVGVPEAAPLVVQLR